MTDKERLDWLENHPHIIGYGPAYHGRMGGWYVSTAQGQDEYPTLRDCIDEASKITP